MLAIALILLAIGVGLWLGWTTPASLRSFLGFVTGAAFFLVAALALYGWQCDAASIPDILLFRDVPGQYFCSGRLTLFTHALVIASIVVALRLVIGKASSPNSSHRDI